MRVCWDWQEPWPFQMLLMDLLVFSVGAPHAQEDMEEGWKRRGDQWLFTICDKFVTKGSGALEKAIHVGDFQDVRTFESFIELLFEYDSESILRLQYVAITFVYDVYVCLIQHDVHACHALQLQGPKSRRLGRAVFVARLATRDIVLGICDDHW